MTIRSACAILLAGFAVADAVGLAQPPALKPKPAVTGVKTTLEIELLTGPDGGAIQAQEWRTVFEQLNVSVSIHKAVLDEKPEVKERVVGTLRYVTVVGRLERSGRIVFADRTF